MVILFLLSFLILPSMQQNYYGKNFGEIVRFTQNTLDTVIGEFDCLAFNNVDYNPELQIYGDYWFTSFRLRGLRNSKAYAYKELNSIKLVANELFIDAIINEHWTFSIKLTEVELYLAFKDTKFELSEFLFLTKEIGHDNYLVDKVIGIILSKGVQQRIIKTAEKYIKIGLTGLIIDNSQRILQWFTTIDASSNSQQFVEKILSNPFVSTSSYEIKIDMQQLMKKNSRRRRVV